MAIVRKPPSKAKALAPRVDRAATCAPAGEDTWRRPLDGEKEPDALAAPGTPVLLLESEVGRAAPLFNVQD